MQPCTIGRRHQRRSEPSWHATTGREALLQSADCFSFGPSRPPSPATDALIDTPDRPKPHTADVRSAVVRGNGDTATGLPPGDPSGEDGDDGGDSDAGTADDGGGVGKSDGCTGLMNPALANMAQPRTAAAFPCYAAMPCQLAGLSAAPAGSQRP